MQYSFNSISRRNFAYYKTLLAVWSHFGHSSVRKKVFMRFPNDLLKRKNGFVMRFLSVALGANLSIYFYEPEGRGFESLLACQQKTA